MVGMVDQPAGFDVPGREGVLEGGQDEAGVRVGGGSQATTRRENASVIADSHKSPSRAGSMVRSATHSRFGPSAVSRA